MTVLPGTVTGRTLTVAGARWPLPQEVPAGPVRLGVRAENWRTGTDDGMALDVTHIERIPTERTAFVHGTIAGLGGTRVVAAVPLDHPERQQLRITPELDRCYLFAADGEEPLSVPGPLELF
jgi:hypothetical protein